MWELEFVWVGRKLRLVAYRPWVPEDEDEDEDEEEEDDDD